MHGKEVDSLCTVAALGSSAFCPVKFTADDCISEHCWPKNLHQFPLPRIPLKSLKSSLIYHGHTKSLKWVCGDEYSHGGECGAYTNIGKGHVREGIYYIHLKYDFITYSWNKSWYSSKICSFFSHIDLINISRAHTGLTKYSRIFRILECVCKDYSYLEWCAFSPCTHDTVN